MKAFLFSALLLPLACLNANAQAFGIKPHQTFAELRPSLIEHSTDSVSSWWAFVPQPNANFSRYNLSFTGSGEVKSVTAWSNSFSIRVDAERESLIWKTEKLVKDLVSRYGEIKKRSYDAESNTPEGFKSRIAAGENNASLFVSWSSYDGTTLPQDILSISLAVHPTSTKTSHIVILTYDFATSGAPPYESLSEGL